MELWRLSPLEKGAQVGESPIVSLRCFMSQSVFVESRSLGLER